MRAHILQSVLALVGKKKPHDILIEEVLDTANISRSTFYSHFNSVWQATSALADEVATGASASLALLYKDLDDPVRRVAVGAQITLWHAAMDTNWGRVFAYCDGLANHSKLLAVVRQDIVNGHKLGCFRQCRVQALIDVHCGALLIAARHLVEQTRGRAAYIQDASTLMLLALGVPAEQADDAIAWARKDIRERASSELEWWTPVR